MSAKKKHYIGVITEENHSSGAYELKFVTQIENEGKYAHWKSGEEAVAFAAKTAEDIAEGLRSNGYVAVVISAPAFLEIRNPEKA